MANDAPVPATRNWRPARPANERKQRAEPAWKATALPAVAVPFRWSRQAKLGVGVVGFLGLAGLLIWASFWLSPPRHACMVLLGAGYELNLAIPHNVYGWNSLADVAKLSRDPNTHFLWGSAGIRLHQERKELRSGDAWDKDLSTCPERTILVFVSLHGGSDEEGGYLLPADADTRPDSRLRLAALFDRLKKLPAEKNKLLVLDATQIHADWSLGMLHNDFARALARHDDDIRAIPNLAVVSASDADQISWSSAPWRQTVFAHYFIEGLRGGALDRDNDGRIDAHELFSYVRPAVDRWVRDNRDAVQTPVLFPSGQEGEDRARQMDLSVVRGYSPTGSLDLPESHVGDEIQRAWAKYRELDDLVPHLVAYAPRQWRMYQASILRYEQLLRAGDRQSAALLADRIQQLEQEMLKLQRLSFTSLQNNLAMPALEGFVYAPDDRSIADFNALWDAAPADRAKKWEQVQKSAVGAQAAQHLRLRMYQLLVDRVQKDPANHLDHAREMLRLFDDPLSPRPCEVQFLALLQRDLPRDPPPPQKYFVLLQEALRIRALAEQTALAAHPGAYPYSEQVFAWIEKHVAEADARRRRALDLVFASDEESWKQSSQLLVEARERYEAARERATAVRDAIALRDRVFAVLPFYSQWLAIRVEPDDKPLRVHESLWRDAHRLAARLAEASPAEIDVAPAARPDDPDPKSLLELVQTVRKGFDDLQAAFMGHCQELSNAGTQKIFLATETALHVPFSQFQVRLALLSSLDQTARRLLVESSDSTRAPTPEPIDTKRNRETVQILGRRQGRMALAVIGQDWFDKARQEKDESYQQVVHRLQTFAVEADWWKSLDRAGEEIGRRWRAIPKAINEQTELGRHAQGNQAVPLFQSAVLLIRQVRSSEAPFVRHHPTDELRRLLVHHLLVWQARRTFEDHYFSDSVDDEPYFRRAAELYLADAQRLDPRTVASADADVDGLRKKLRGPARLVFVGPKKLLLTTEQEADVTFRLAPETGAELPPGIPVLWFDSGGSIEMIEPRAAARQARPFDKDRPADELRGKLRSPDLLQAESNPPPTPRVTPTTLRVRGLFRGQRIEFDTPVSLFLLPDQLVYQTPMPTIGSVALRASGDVQNRFGASSGRIAIVLDASGSMGPPVNGAWGPTTKYNEATRALRDVLGKLPKGTTISIWVFGQAVGNAKTVADPESTIRRLQDPVAWDPANADLVKKVMAKVEYPTIEPWNESPIVRSMLAAAKDLETGEGFKTLLVITDGMDNRFAKDAQVNPAKQDIPTFLLQHFKNSGIMINVIGFKVESKEEKQARAQFKVVEDLPVPGRYVTEEDAAQLASVVQRAMRQKIRYWIDTADNIPVPANPKLGLEVSKAGENDQWFPGVLSPGIFKLRVVTDRRLEKHFEIARGDEMLIHLDRGPQGLLFRRESYSKADYDWKPAVEKQDWRLAVLQNQLVGESGVQMLLTLERLPDPRETTLQQVKPRHAWFELAPTDGGAAKYLQRWGYQPGYPAPAWSLEVPAWPNQPTPGSGGAAAQPASGLARPTLRAWWNPDQETPIGGRLDREADFGQLADLTDKTLTIEGDTVVIESVRVETHLVEVMPGQREAKSCLVVRAAHAPGRPVWIRVDGLTPRGFEQRYFADANKTTALFWDVDLATAAKELKAIRLYSVRGFKETAERRGFAVEMKELGAPRVNDVRPQPPIPLNP